MRRWDGLVENYIRVCEARGLAASTLSLRRRELERFGIWAKRRRPRPQLESVNSELVIRYIRDRSAFRSRATVAGVVSELRGMGEFLVCEGLWSSNPLRWIRGPKLDPRRHRPRNVGRGQLKALWKAAHSRRGAHARYQAVCVLAILYGTGLRRGELERLDLNDWDRDNGILKVDGRKTGQPRFVPVAKAVWRCIEAYLPHRHNRLEQRGTVGESALLINSLGRRLRGQNLHTLLHRLARTAEVEPVTAHQFRHTCASDLLESGVPLPDVQRFLGHAAIESTMRYVAIANPERVAAIAKHPLNGFLAASDYEGNQHDTH